MRRGEGRGGNERRGNRRGPQALVHTPMSEILKNTLIAELIWLAGRQHRRCPGRQTTSRRHWETLIIFRLNWNDHRALINLQYWLSADYWSLVSSRLAQLQNFCSNCVWHLTFMPCSSGLEFSRLGSRSRDVSRVETQFWKSWSWSWTLKSGSWSLGSRFWSRRLIILVSFSRLY